MLASLVLSSQLLIDSLSPASQVGLIIGSVLALVDRRNEPRSVGEEIVHLLQRKLLGLGNESPDAKGVGEVADDKDEVVLPADRAHGNTGDLSDHGVESERGHGGEGDTLGTSAGIEDLGRDDPG